MMWPCGGRASCLELPTPEVRALDNQRYEDPTPVAETATARLDAGTAGNTSLIRAELYLVLGFARAEQNRISEARVALEEARKLISALPGGSDARRLEMRLAMASFGVSFTQSSYAVGRTNLDRLLMQTGAGTLERVCLLVARGEFEAEMDRPDLAAEDLLTGFRAARSARWTDAATTAAFALATTYRRSSLWSDAEAMIDEVLRYATAHHYTWYLAVAELTRGQILVDERRWDQAYASLARGADLAMSLGDTLTAAFAARPMCDALLNSGRIAEARTVCSAKFAAFVQMGRSDLAADSMMYQARIELLDGDNAAALALLNTLLTDHLDDVPPRSLSSLYRERAQALSALGRFRESSVDLERSLAAADAAASTERQRTAAVLTGIAKAQALESANRELTRVNETQQRQLESQRQVHRLSIGLAAAGLIVSVLLGYLLVLGHRTRRALARQAAVLDRMNEGVVVIDEGDRIVFANAAMYELLGYPPGSLLNAPASSLTADQGAWARLPAVEAPARVEANLRRHDAAYVLVSITSSPMIFGARTARIFVCRDISGQRLVERAVAGVTGREALRVGDSLHEGLAQELTGVSLLLRSLVGPLYRVDPAVGASAQDVTEYLSRAILTARELAQLISPMAAAHGGLGSALRILADDTAKRLGVSVTYPSTIEEVDLQGTIAADLYRIARDTLGYAERRLHCTVIGVDLYIDSSAVTLTISWEGSERDPTMVESTRFDLEIIRYRARLLDGLCERFACAPPRDGITIRVPLTSATVPTVA